MKENQKLIFKIILMSVIVLSCADNNVRQINYSNATVKNDEKQWKVKNGPLIISFNHLTIGIKRSFQYLILGFWSKSWIWYVFYNIFPSFSWKLTSSFGAIFEKLENGTMGPWDHGNHGTMGPWDRDHGTTGPYYILYHI